MTGYVIYCFVGIIFWMTSSCESLHCHDYLISGPRGIVDGYMTASSVQDHCTAAARIDGNISNDRVWCPVTQNVSEFLQIKFSTKERVEKILTEGRPNGERVTSYNLHYSSDGKRWKAILDGDGNATRFPANVESQNLTEIKLPTPISTAYLRIYPMSWMKWPSMKIEVLGCHSGSKDTYKSANKQQWEAYIRKMYSVSPQATWTSVETEMWKCGRKCFESSSCSSFTYNSASNLCVAHRDLFFTYSANQLSKQPADPASKIYYTKVSWSSFGYVRHEPFDGPIKVHTYRANYITATAYCWEELSTLIVIQSRSEAQTMWAYTRSNIVLTLEDTFLVGGMNKSSEWRFWNEQIIPPNLWAPTFPNSDIGNCVALTEDGLKSINCQDKYYFICGY